MLTVGQRDSKSAADRAAKATVASHEKKYNDFFGN